MKAGLSSLTVFTLINPSSGLWRERPARPDSGEEEHLHRDPLLDGTRGHRLRREPRRHVRLQSKSLRQTLT